MSFFYGADTEFSYRTSLGGINIYNLDTSTSTEMISPILVVSAVIFFYEDIKLTFYVTGTIGNFFLQIFCR